MYEVLYFENRRGRCPVKDFLKTMKVQARSKAMKWIEKLSLEGPDLPRPYADVLRGKIRELRLVFGSDSYRFLYFFVGKKIIITHGFLKKDRKTPPGQIRKAESMMADFIARQKKLGG